MIKINLYEYNMDWTVYALKTAEWFIKKRKLFQPMLF